MIWGYESILTIVLAVLALLITVGAQININFTYDKYKRVKTKKGYTGQEVARKILDANGLKDVYVVEVRGKLTDHYDPSRKVVRLSPDIYNGDSIASASVAAHECGHAIQDDTGYKFMKIRAFLVPIVNFISYLGYFSLIISIIAGATGYIKLCLLVLVATLVFQLVTLPVEFDASKRAGVQLVKLNLLNKNELSESKKVLTSAALTYVAALASTVLDILRLLIMLAERDDR